MNRLARLRERLADVQVFASRKSRRRFLLHATVAILVLAVLVLAVRRYMPFLTDASELRAVIREFGIWAPVVLIVLQTLQVVLAPIPGQVLAVVAGYLFGAWLGTLYNMVGIVLGSTIAFWLARRYGRAYVERIVHEETLARFDAVDDDHARLSLFFFFLVPGLPDDVLCFVGGLTRLPIWQLVAIAIVGRTPAFFLVNVVGEFLGTNQMANALTLAAVLVAITILGYLNRDRIIGLLDDS